MTTGGWNWKYLRQARSGPGICGVCARGMASYLSCWDPLDLSVPKRMIPVPCKSAVKLYFVSRIEIGLGHPALYQGSTGQRHSSQEGQGSTHLAMKTLNLAGTSQEAGPASTSIPADFSPFWCAAYNAVMASTWLCPAFSAKILAGDGGILKLKVGIYRIYSVGITLCHVGSASIYLSVSEKKFEHCPPTM